MNRRQLDGSASRHFTWRQLIQAGETHQRLREQGVLVPLPDQEATWAALQALAEQVLDPLIDRFGPAVVTYGFAPPELTRHVEPRPGNGKLIAPRLDQHAGSELGPRGAPVCARGGAAVDLIVPGCSMRAVAEWATELPVDRLYFYGDGRPLHMSWSTTPKRQFYQLTRTLSGRLVPRTFRVLPVGDKG